MRTRNPLTAAALTALTLTCSDSPVRAADLFAESFDSEIDNRVEPLNGNAGLATFVDYSNMTVGALTHNIPEAPRRISGSGPTKGMLLQVAYTTPEGAATLATERIVNLVAVDEFRSRLQFEDNYRLKFDLYLRISPSVTISAAGIPTDAGTTEQALWGVGYNASSPMARGWRSGRGSGMWGWLTTDCGHGATVGGDAALYRAGIEQGARNMNVTDAAEAYFLPAFGADATPQPRSPANQWVEATMTVQGKVVTVEYKAVGRAGAVFYDRMPGFTTDVEGNETSFVSGGVMVGYEDSFNSVSFDPDNQWMLVDNMVVEELTASSMLVRQERDTTTYTGGAPTTAVLKVENTRASGDLSISAVNIGGADAAAFTLATPLPLNIPAGSSANLTLNFAPGGANGVKTASVTLVSNDPQTPEYVIGALLGRRSVPGVLEARYQMEETTGATLADSSGSGAPGGLQVREPLVFGQPALQTGATGSAIGFLPAQTGTTGNYFTSPVANTPIYSVSLWIRPASTGGNRTIFARDPDFDTTHEEVCGLILDASGTLIYRVAGADAMTSDTVLTDGEVYHVVVTHYDSTGFGDGLADRCRIYVNGIKTAELAGELAGGLAPQLPDYPLTGVVAGTAMHVGSRTAAGSGFQGEMDDFQLYGVELTPEQVWDIYKRPAVTALQSPAFSVVSAASSPAGFAVAFPSSPSVQYQLLRTVDLSTWAPVGNAVSGDPEQLTTTITDPSPPAGRAFYKVEGL